MPSTQNEDLGFESFNLKKCLTTVLNELGYHKPTEIQKTTIPYILEGRDVLGQAETGSGKTAAFSLPILSSIDLNAKLPQALILTPTRELSIQVSEAIKNYGQDFKRLKVLPIYGGQSYSTQINSLKGSVQIVVGTPGRVKDLIQKEKLNLSQISHLVLDEADEMLNMGFIEDVEWIIDQTPKQRQTVLFSATMPGPIKKLTKKILNNPADIQIKKKTNTASTILQEYMVAPRKKKVECLIQLLDTRPHDGIIVFAKTKSITIELAEILISQGYRCKALNGEMQQITREKTIESFKKGAFDIIVATDIAARGIDVERITHVINYNIPHNAMAYIHRIGRTGRAGRAGASITFVDPAETRSLRDIEKSTKQKMTEIDCPTDEQLKQSKFQKFQDKLNSVLSSEQNLSEYKQMIESFADQNNIEMVDAAAALMKIVFNKKPVKTPNEPSDSRRKPANPSRLKSKSFSSSSKREKKPKRRSKGSMLNYQLKVGKKDGVLPRNIVGAIANEISISSRDIGDIKILKSHSIVELPADLPQKALKILSNAWVAGKQLKIARVDG